MKNLKHTWLCLLLAVSFAGAAQANLALDTVDANSPQGSSPVVLDNNDFYAAEFSLAAGSTITDIQAYINAGASGQAGDQFSFHIYANDGSIGLPGTDLYSASATYNADGWNGLSNLSVSGLSAGNYWLALETGGFDLTTGQAITTTLGLELPSFASNGTVPALAYAFNAGSGYTTMTGTNFGLQVTSVPVPPSVLLFMSGLFAVGRLAKRKAV